MKVLLALGVVLALYLEQCSAYCSYGQLSLDSKRKPVCIHNGEVHKIDTDWPSGCEKCSCRKTGMQCCAEIETPSMYDKENCEAIFHEDTCSYTVTRKDNPSVKCEVLAMIG
ncbi:hypothetical protein GDO81_004366 [Engystomops pustulosus]|uniref:Beta-microseminoprotein n=1 Tax=Engystomops pustulosus TaxID=76066 RepID=A0AAV6ZWY1_ENGPU|nr:hypothetical protein GDO81_004366 [Engystomops pustulosus]